jgi:hypothetical protein
VEQANKLNVGLESAYAKQAVFQMLQLSSRWRGGWAGGDYDAASAAVQTAAMATMERI